MFSWLKTYRTSQIPFDLIAGITAAAICIPESLGYSAILGVSPQFGLYTAMVGAVAFAIFASSRQLVVGPDGATAVIVAGGALGIAAAGSTKYFAAIITITLLTGVVLLLMALFRLGFLANLISQPVLVGFISGVGLELMITKVPSILGIKITGSTTMSAITGTFQNLGHINWWNCMLGVITVVIMLGSSRINEKLPAALIAIVVASVIGSLVHITSHGVKVVGAIPKGLPKISLHDFDWTAVAREIPIALAAAIVVLACSAAVARIYSTKNNYPLNENQDLVGLGIANAVSSLVGGYPVNGSAPRTAASDGVGGKSKLVNVFMAIVVLIVVLTLTGIFKYLPAPVVDGVVFSLGFNLFTPGALVKVYKQARTEFWIAIVALIVVCFVGVQQGIGLAVLISLVQQLRRSYKPSEEVLYADGKPDSWLEEWYEPSTGMDNVVIYRFGGNLFFANASYFDERVRELVADPKEKIATVVLVCRAIESIDYSAAQVLIKLNDDLRAKGCTLVFSELPPELHATLNDLSLDGVVIVNSLSQAIARLEAGDITTPVTTNPGSGSTPSGH